MINREKGVKIKIGLIKKDWSFSRRWGRPNVYWPRKFNDKSS